MKKLFFLVLASVNSVMGMEDQKDNDPFRIRKVVEEIVAKKGNINASIYPSDSLHHLSGVPLILAVSGDDAYTDLVTLLLENETLNIKACDIYGANMLHIAMKAPHNLQKLVDHIKKKKIAFLLDEKDGADRPPLELGFMVRRFPSAKLLLESGACVHTFNRVVGLSPLAHLFYVFHFGGIHPTRLDSLSRFTRLFLLWGADPTWADFKFETFELRGKMYEKAVKNGRDAYDCYVELDKKRQTIVKQAFSDIKLFHDLKSLDRKDPKSYLSGLPGELFSELRSFTAGIDASKRMDACLPVQSYEAILNRKETL